MGSHPINLGIRFILEMSALIFSGMWAWQQYDSWLRYLLTPGIPVFLATIWGVFAVPNDPSRSGAAPVATSGIIRLFIELAIFAFATWAIYKMEYDKIGFLFLVVVLLHYTISYDRIKWLLIH